MYQVLARRWRPQTFAELVGQGHVARTLANAISTGRMAHAYIFAGVRGTGKTTVARILAKCLNCEKGPTDTPCGTCASCEEIAASRSMDVLEIDAASRTKVEQTRELLEIVSYAPVRDRYKILIIDEAHMLSKSSFNALLKTLEEPPPNVLFVLATTELHKILATIVSRCQVFEFRRVSVAEVAAHLRKITSEGGIAISDESLERLARAGEGSVRDSLSQLERVLAFCGEQAADEDVLRLLGAVRIEVLGAVVSAIARRDAAAMLATLDALVDEGHDLVHFWIELISALRDLLVADSLPSRPELLSRPAAEARALVEAATGLGRDDLNRAFAILAELEPGLKSSSQPRFLFEAALIRLASLGSLRPIEELIAEFGASAPPRADPPRPPAPTPRTATTAVPVGKPPAAAPREPPSSAPKAATAPSRAASEVSRGDLLAAIRGERPMLAAILEEATTIVLANATLDIRFPPEQSALLRQCQQPESQKLLRETAAVLAGRPVALRVGIEGEASEPPQRHEPSAGGDEPPAPRRAVAPKSPSSSLLEQAKQEPGVQRLLETFGAQVVEIGPFELASAGEPVSEPDTKEET